MSYKILLTRTFEKEIKRLLKKFPSLKQEFSQLIFAITQNPDTVVYLGNNCYKIRLAIGSKGKGKSGGARVITYLYVKKETVFLLSIYDKSEKENLKTNELIDMIESLDLD